MVNARVNGVVDLRRKGIESGAFGKEKTDHYNDRRENHITCSSLILHVLKP